MDEEDGEMFSEAMDIVGGERLTVSAVEEEHIRQPNMVVPACVTEVRSLTQNAGRGRRAGQNGGQQQQQTRGVSPRQRRSETRHRLVVGEHLPIVSQSDLGDAASGVSAPASNSPTLLTTRTSRRSGRTIAPAARYDEQSQLSDFISFDDMHALHAELTHHHSFAARLTSVWTPMRDRVEPVADFRLIIKDGMQERDAPQVIIEDIALDYRVFARPAATGMASGEVAAAIVLDQDEDTPTGRDICINYRSNGKLKCVPEFHQAVDCLTYPLLFPFGENGYDYMWETSHRQRVTIRQHYSYYCQQRHPDHDFNLLHRSQRLMQELDDVILLQH